MSNPIAEDDGSRRGPLQAEVDTSTDPGRWVTPRYAFGVVIAAALTILGVLAFAMFQLTRGSQADPNAATIASLASAAFATLSSLVAAYFGIKAASEQSAQAAATTNAAVRALQMSR